MAMPPRLIAALTLGGGIPRLQATGWRLARRIGRCHARSPGATLGAMDGEFSARALEEGAYVPARPRLTAERRTVLGKKVKRLRREGLTPANLVEPLKASVAIQVAESELAGLVRHGGSGHLVDLVWCDETQPVLMDQVEIDAITNRLLHATFRRVDLSKPVTVAVPVHLEGTAPASEVADFVVIQALSEIDVSALPAEIPSYLIGDATVLRDVGDEVRVADLRAADGAFEAVTDPSEAVVAVHLARVAEEEVPAEEAELEEVELEAEGEAAVEEAAPEAEAGRRQGQER